MLFDYENGIRGGTTRRNCHYAGANNEYMHRYDKWKQSTYTKYYDFSNQYGWSLSQTLPCDEHEYFTDILMFAAGSVISFNEKMHLFFKKVQIILKNVHRVCLNDVIG